MTTVSHDTLWVATDLSWVEVAADVEPTTADVIRDGKMFRRLDPDYFAWLWRAMTTAEYEAANDRLESGDYEELRRRFNGIYFWAAKHFNRVDLLRAVNTLDRRYVPPATPSSPSRQRKPVPTSPETPGTPPTDIRGIWAAGTGTLRLARQEHPFRPWSPSLGRVYTKGFAFDSETTLIQGYETPDYVLGAVYGDTGQGYFLTPDVVEAFFHLHSDLHMALHNAEFDLRVLDKLAPALNIYDWVDANRVWDTRLLHRGYCLGTEGHTAGWKDQSTLEVCAREYVGLSIPKDVTDSQGNNVRMSYSLWKGRSLTEVEDVYLTYLATDAVTTLLVFREVYQRLMQTLRSGGNVWGFVSQDWLDRCLERWGPQTHHLRLQAEIVLRRATQRGALIDPPNREQAKTEVQQVIDENLRVMAEEYNFKPGEKVKVQTEKGEEWLGPDKRLQQIIADLDREIDGLELQRTPTRKYRATKDVIEELVQYSPFFNHLHDYKVAAKLMATYLDKMGTGPEEKILHPSYDVLKASGRTSSFGEINAQNLPKKDGRVRRCFVPRPGSIFLDFDYKAIELATLAQAVLAQFRLPSKMAEAINDGKDLHRKLAATIFQIPEEQVTEDQRSAAKPANFGLPGGMTARTFRAYFLTSVKHDGKLTPEQKAKLEQWATLENSEKAVEAWFDTWPEMRNFLEKDDSLLREIAKFFELTPEHYQLFTGRSVRNEGYREPAEWLGGMFLKTIKSEDTPIKQDGAEYDRDQVAFFWTMLDGKSHLLPMKAQKLVVQRRPGPTLFNAVRNHVSRAPVFTLTGRLRAKATYCSRHNTTFQGLAADGACRAMWLIWRAGYTISNFVHDQFVIEVPAVQDLRPHIASVQQLMIQGMRDVLPDLRVDVDAIVAMSWAKQDKVNLNENGYSRQLSGGKNHSSSEEK